MGCNGLACLSRTAPTPALHANLPFAIWSIAARALATGLVLACCVLTAGAQGTADRRAGVDPDQPLRIATWHLQDLWHQIGEPLRDESAASGLVRDEAAWARLRQVAENLDADVIALQGAGSLRAVRRLFSARTHQVVFSQQLAQRLSRDPRVLRSRAWRQGYTALAIRRRRGLRVASRVHLRNLITATAVARANVSPPVAGTAVQLLSAGRPVWVVSANIDGDCREQEGAPAQGDQSAEDSGASDAQRARLRACRAANEQAAVLQAWARERRAAGEPFIFAGRFPAFLTAGSGTQAGADTARQLGNDTARQSAGPSGRLGRGVVWELLNDQPDAAPERTGIGRNTVAFVPPSRSPGTRWQAGQQRTPAATSALGRSSGERSGKRPGNRSEKPSLNASDTRSDRVPDTAPNTSPRPSSQAASADTANTLISRLNAAIDKLAGARLSRSKPVEVSVTAVPLPAPRPLRLGGRIVQFGSDRRKLAMFAAPTQTPCGAPITQLADGAATRDALLVAARLAPGTRAVKLGAATRATGATGEQSASADAVAFAATGWAAQLSQLKTGCPIVIEAEW